MYQFYDLLCPECIDVFLLFISQVVVSNFCCWREFFCPVKIVCNHLCAKVCLPFLLFSFPLPPDTHTHTHTLSLSLSLSVCLSLSLSYSVRFGPLIIATSASYFLLFPANEGACSSENKIHLFFERNRFQISPASNITKVINAMRHIQQYLQSCSSLSLILGESLRPSG